MSARPSVWWRRLPVHRKITSVLLAVLVPVILAIAVHVQQISRLQQLERERHDVVLAREQARILETLAIDIEDGFRGYLLTQNPQFLAPLREAEGKVEPTLEGAVRRLDDFPALAGDLAASSLQLQELLRSKQELIERVRDGESGEVIEYVRSGEGLALSNAIRREFRSIEAQFDTAVETLDATTFQVAQGAFWGLLLAVVGGVLLGLAGSWLLTVSITRPLKMLDRRVRELGRAVRSAAPGLAGRGSVTDEIGQVAESFESMGQEIKTYIQELEAIDEIGHEINTIRPDGLDGVLQRITNLAADVLQADLCMVVSRNEGMGCWVIEAASGRWHDRLHQSVMLWEELPVSVQAFETKQPVVGEGLRTDRRPGVSRRNTFIGDSTLSIPLLSQDVPFGVLVLARTGAGPGQAWNIRLASSFANEAAMAISNARLFERAEQRGKSLERRIQELEHLAETLAHDLRGPGERMMGLGDLLQKHYGAHLDERASRWLMLLAQNGREMVARAERILEVAQIGVRHDRLEVVDPAVVLNDVLKMRAAELEEHRVTVDVTGESPLVACHRAYLQQIFDNLVSNAVKFTGGRPSPRMRISLSRREGSARFAVSDNGIGIPVEDHERVFEPFVRLRPDSSPGSGIGLAIVQRIVHLYGGRIWIESNVDEGCTVWFTMPAVASPSEETPSAPHVIDRSEE